MEHLDYFLEKLVSHNAGALCLEPNKNPYVKTESNESVDLTKAPMQLAQINTMVFELMPPEVREELPDNDVVSFTHTRGIGSFNFSVRKSASGFSVTINPSESVNAVANSESETIPNSQPEESSSPKLNNNPDNAENAVKEDDTTTQHMQNSGNQPLQGNNPIENKPAQNLSPLDKLKSTLSAKKGAPNGGPAGSAETAPAPQQPPSAAKPTATPPVSQQAVTQSPNAPVVQNEPTIEVVTPPPPPVVQTPSVAPPTPSQSASVSASSDPKAKGQMDALFSKMAEIGASDLHMSVSAPPMVRKDGRMANLDDSQPVLTPDSIKALLSSIMPQKNIDEFAERNDTDFAYEIPGLARFRANIFMDRKGMGGVFRIIPSDIMTAEDLNLSKHIMDLCDLSKGLVVVTGPTGSGKSTTLCAMVDSINKTREDHIITIEDPIEFTHDNQKCLVNQREVHNHTESFKDALRAALREDPDILLVGEMRDLETISIAIETAETGHLVFGTLHTTTAASTVDRIIDQFPADRQQQVRVMLSESLRGVIAQTLLPKIGGGRIAALEVLIVTPAISNLIREGKTFQIPSAMQTGKNKGMVMLNDALMDLVNKGLVEPKDAYVKSVDKTGFEMLLQRAGKKI